MKNIARGVYPTMITPYTEDNRIDYQAVERLLQWYAERNADGVFAICQSSEIFFLSFDERISLLKFILDHRPKGLTVIASGHTADDREEQIEQAKRFIDTGVDAYVFIANRFAAQEESSEVFLERMLRAAGALDESVPLGIYECPYPYKRLMGLEELRVLSQTGRFCFLKDTCCDAQQIRERLEVLRGSGFQLFNANAATLLETLRAGCAGYSGVMGNFHPELYAWLCKNFDTDPSGAERMQAFLGFASLAECQMYPVNAKYYLSLEGLGVRTHCRCADARLFAPSRRLEIEQMHALTQWFKRAFPAAL